MQISGCVPLRDFFCEYSDHSNLHSTIKLQQRFMHFHMEYVPSERFQYRKIPETFEIDFCLIGSIQFQSGTQFAQNVSHPTLIAMMLSL